MRIALHWRGKPLLAVDLTAHTPDDGDPSLEPPHGMSASAGGLHERAEPMEAPDTTVRFGFGGAA